MKWYFFLLLVTLTCLINVCAYFTNCTRKPLRNLQTPVLEFLHHLSYRGFHLHAASIWFAYHLHVRENVTQTTLYKNHLSYLWYPDEKVQKTFAIDQNTQFDDDPWFPMSKARNILKVSQKIFFKLSLEIYWLSEHWTQYRGQGTPK